MILHFSTISNNFTVSVDTGAPAEVASSSVKEGSCKLKMLVFAVDLRVRREFEANHRLRDKNVLI